MISFKEYLLLEAADVKFSHGKDQDYTSHPSQVVIFVKEDADEYVVEGKTHGSLSHAIKHLHEFNYNRISTIVKNAKADAIKYLQSNPNQFCAIYDEIRGMSTDTGVAAMKKSTQLALLNSLDIINDKIIQKKKLLPIEHILKRYCKSIDDIYKNVIETKMKASEDLTELNLSVTDFEKIIKSSDIIKFEAESSIAPNLYMYLDFTDYSIIITNTKDIVKSCYKVDRASNVSTFISEFYNKKFKAKNPELNKALMSLI